MKGDETPGRAKYKRHMYSIPMKLFRNGQGVGLISHTTNVAWYMMVVSPHPVELVHDGGVITPRGTGPLSANSIDKSKLPAHCESYHILRCLLSGEVLCWYKIYRPSY